MSIVSIAPCNWAIFCWSVIAPTRLSARSRADSAVSCQAELMRTSVPPRAGRSIHRTRRPPFVGCQAEDSPMTTLLWLLLLAPLLAGWLVQRRLLSTFARYRQMGNLDRMDGRRARPRAAGRAWAGPRSAGGGVGFSRRPLRRRGARVAPVAASSARAQRRRAGNRWPRGIP